VTNSIDIDDGFRRSASVRTDLSGRTTRLDRRNRRYVGVLGGQAGQVARHNGEGVEGTGGPKLSCAKKRRRRLYPDVSSSRRRVRGWGVPQHHGYPCDGEADSAATTIAAGCQALTYSPWIRHSPSLTGNGATESRERNDVFCF
jgi:hypothetical protein